MSGRWNKTVSDAVAEQEGFPVTLGKLRYKDNVRPVEREVPLVLPSYLRMGECACIRVCSHVEGRGQPRVSVPRHSPRSVGWPARSGDLPVPTSAARGYQSHPQQLALPWSLRTEQALVCSCGQHFTDRTLVPRAPRLASFPPQPPEELVR